MAVITLISDIGSSGFYAAAIKASILAKLPSASIVDITHNIPPFHIPDAAFVLRNVYHNFPAGTVHLVAVDAQSRDAKRYIALQCEGHYFVGSDSGLFGLALGDKPLRVVEIGRQSGSTDESFPAAGLLAITACRIAGGEPLESIGDECTDMKRLTALQPTYNDYSITTQIIYADEYGNCFCNLDKFLFEKAARDRSFLIEIKEYRIEAISKNYDEVEAGEIIALFSNSGLLELAMAYGNLAQIVGVKKDDRILITFNG